MTRTEAIESIMDHMRVHKIGEYPHIQLKTALDMAITALRELDEVDSIVRVVESNEPLTLEELCQMNGEPVFVVEVEGKIGRFKKWCVLDDDRALISGVACFWWKFKDYGKIWLAYRRKPEEVSE